MDELWSTKAKALCAGYIGCEIGIPRLNMFGVLSDFRRKRFSGAITLYVGGNTITLDRNDRVIF